MKSPMCQKNGFEYCCVNFKKKGNTCVPCPAGTFGKDCSVPCPPNHHGLFCERKCNCDTNQVCLPKIGCFPLITNLTFINKAATHESMTTDNTWLVPVLCTVSVLITGVILVLFLLKRSIFCKDKFNLLQQSYTEREDQENTHQNRLDDIDRFASTNHNGRHECTLAIEDPNYEEIDNGASNEYNLLELRLRNVSCVSVELDKLDDRDEYVTLKHEGVMGIKECH